MEEDLRRLVQGQLRASKLPSKLDLSPLQEGLADLCHRSLRVPPGTLVPLPSPVVGQVEWGSCIALVVEDLQLLHPIAGRADGVDPGCTPDEHKPHVYVGFAHTHLPDAASVPYPGFSARDFQASLADGDNLALVCNGPEVFALVRTADRTESPRVPSAKEFREWEQLYDDLIARSTTLDAALWQANREMCRKLGLAFYRGVWGQSLDLIYRPR